MAKIISDNISNMRSGADIKTLFNLYYSRLVYFSFLITNNKPQSEDIAQDAFVKFWDNSENITNHPVAVKNFLYSSVKNASLNAVRHNKVTEQHIKSLHNLPVEEAVFHSIIRAEVIAEIHGAIALLPKSCQQIFKMSYLDEMKNHQIADVLGISVNTVKTQKQRALKVLKGQLSPDIFIVLMLIAIR